MKRSEVVFAVFILVSILSLSAANANGIEQSGRFGLGLAIGYPGLGLSTNTFLADDISLKGELYPFYGFNGGVLDVDYLFWLHDIAKSSALDFTWFAGPGAALVFWGGNDRYHKNDRHGNNDGGMAVVAKGAIGLALQFNAQPIDLCLEFSPGVLLDENGSSLWFTGMIASRYYF
jgi:hypothetical protein